MILEKIILGTNPEDKTHSLRTQTSDDRKYVCVRRLKDSEKPYPVQRHIWKCSPGLEYPRDHISYAIQQNEGLFFGSGGPQAGEVTRLGGVKN